MNKETLRMQMLAGVITESQYKTKLKKFTILENKFKAATSRLMLNEVQFNDNDKALGTLIFPNDEDDKDTPYVHDYYAYVSLLKDMGYSQEQIDEDLDEYFHYTSAFNEEEMHIYKYRTGIKNLRPEDVTVGMIKDELRDEFGTPQ